MFLYKKIILLLILLFLWFPSIVFSQDQLLNLKQGYNFISFTVKPNLTPQQLKMQNSSIDDIYAFSSSSGSFLSIEDGSLLSLNTEKGYIIKMSTASVIDVDGVIDSSSPSFTKSLKAGFNLIGISKDVGSPKFSDVLKYSPDVFGIYKWSISSGTFIPVHNVNGLGIITEGIDPAFVPGQSYFVNTKLNSDATLYFVPKSDFVIRGLDNLDLNKSSDYYIYNQSTGISFLSTYGGIISNYQISWISSDPTVLSINSDKTSDAIKVTALKSGTSILSVSYTEPNKGSFTKTFLVTVQAPITYSFNINGSSNLTVGNNYQYKVLDDITGKSLIDVYGSKVTTLNNPFWWTSSDATILPITSSNTSEVVTVKPLKVGTSILQVFFYDFLTSGERIISIKKLTVTVN